MSQVAPEAAVGRQPESALVGLISAAVSIAGVVVGTTAPGAIRAIADRPGEFASLLVLVLLLQLANVQVYGRGAISFAGAGLLAVGFAFGVGAAMLVAVLAAAMNLLLRHGKGHRALFDAAQLALAAAAGAGLYHVIGAERLPAPARIGPALASALVFYAVNVGLLSLAMGFSEGLRPTAVWRERFRWMTPYYLASGPLALACVLAYRELHLVGLVAFALPPAFMMLSVRQYLGHTERAVGELRAANEALVEHNAQIRKVHLETIAALARSMEAKDYYTGGHTERVSAFAVGIARQLGYAGEELEAIEIGALLHDIGKIGIPERILNKQGPLDEEEWKVMREHPVISDYILSGLDLHPIVRQIARSSHEWIDGRGYPDGLAGDAVPLPARIVLVADALDALTSDRSYRRARPAAAALAELHAHSGTQFCPTVLAALERLHAEEPELFGTVTLRAVDAA